MARFVEWLLLVPLVQILGDDRYSMCPTGLFIPEGESTCRPCSGCPDNEVVKETCLGHRDTVCGPFVEFKAFNFQVHNDKTTTHPTPSRTDSGTEDTLYTLSIVLMALLAITSAVCVSMAALICYRRRRDRKELLMEQAGKDAVAGSYDTIDPPTRRCRRRPPSMSGNDQADTARPSSSNIEQFEIAEEEHRT
ncbi:uncharacterized protein LOC128245503 [Mya arenaria]|nr:uncharacterized protein LOC128245503 [Mya arenaria]